MLSVCGEALDVEGQCELENRLAGKVIKQDFLVVRGVGVPILGIDSLKRNSIVTNVASRIFELEGVTVPFDGGDQTKVLRYHSDSVKNFELALRRTLDSFNDIIQQDGNYSDGTNLIEYDITLDDETPVHVRPRPIPFHMRNVVQEQISRMIDLGVIKECEPVVFTDYLGV